MRFEDILTVVLSQLGRLQRRQTYDTGQWTVVPTLISWTTSPTVYWQSTQIITEIVTVPCSVYTSYTTITTSNCPDNCGGAIVTTCLPKTCSTLIYDVGTLTSEPFSAGDTATATWSNGGLISTLEIPASQCSVTAAFVAPADAVGYPACGDVVPANGFICAARLCTTVYTSPFVTNTRSLTYGPTEQAVAILTADPISTSAVIASACTSFTNVNIGTATPSCGATAIDTGSGTCGSSIVTYSYTSNGATFVVATAIAQHCGPFQTLHGNGSTWRLNINVMFWAWSVTAGISCFAMLML